MHDQQPKNYQSQMNKKRDESDCGEIKVTASQRGYQSTRSNKSLTSGGDHKQKIGSVDGIHKKKTLHINDYKQFKKIRNIQDRY